ncbi:beta-galactosidase-1-like protein 2 [Halichondria panicea]|uniref:beta-galactosidase-1-like protein 2 n=1 Tax=Halichondria panicea TaxID=6063 RepID=UPI00312B71B3
MIRMKIPFTRTNIRIKGTTKWQIGVAIVIGFVGGYLLLPYVFPVPPPSYGVRSVGVRDRHHPFGAPAKLSPGGQDQKKWADMLKSRVRDRAVHFDSTGRHFIVEGKEKLILSGAVHYFRVVPAYWEDRLLRLKAAGLNTVETYVPWNMHEPLPGQFDFTGILDLGEYIRTAQQVGLHVIVRPGPYICAEWEMGGLPAWLLHYRDMQVRTTHREYMNAVEQYFRQLFEVLIPLQSAYGGPIIAFQLENEYGAVSVDDDMGKDYMTFLFQMLREMNVVELLFVSDGAIYFNSTLSRLPMDEVLITVNFMNERGALDTLNKIQPSKPAMIMEWWSGWFDHWQEDHLTRNQGAELIAERLTDYITRGVSVNFYMFHGGTNFGFMNGGNWDRDMHGKYQPTVTSYDYDAPVSECGDLTEKYINIREVIRKYAPDSMPTNPLPPLPGNLPKRAYDETRLTLYIPITSTLQFTPEPYYADRPIPMEYLPLNKGWGQGYGYILYRTTLPRTASKVSVYGLNDYGVAMINSVPVKQLSYFKFESFVIPENAKTKSPEGEGMTLDILVENAGRVNFGSPLENRKGINGKVMVDGKEQLKWKMYSLEFKSSYVESIYSGGMWQRTPSPTHPGPALFKGTFTIQGPACDTFLDMKGWGKGVVFINGANLGRYWSVGPQRTLYVPGPVLREGVNKVVIFEFHQPKIPQSIVFRDSPILDKDHAPLQT